MMMLWAWAGVPLGVYNIVKEYNIALRIQPQILTFLSLVTWIQCYYYERVRNHPSNYSSKKLTATRNGASTDHSSWFSPSQPSWEAFKQA